MPPDDNPPGDPADPSPTLTSERSTVGPNPPRRLWLPEHPLLAATGGIIVMLLSVVLAFNFTQTARLDHRIDRLEDRVDAGFAKVDARFERVDARFERVDARFDRVDARFDELEAKFDDLNLRLTALIAALNATAQVEAAVNGELLSSDATAG